MTEPIKPPLTPSELGRLGGSARSEAKTKAVRKNAKKGGWPKGKPRKPVLNAEQIARAGFPGELLPYIKNKTLEFMRSDDNGTLVFLLPKHEAERELLTLEWHPDQPELWTLEGQRFTLRSEKFRDRGCNDPLGHEFLEPENLEQLVDYLDTIPD